MPNMPHRCWAAIDLAAFERNLKRIQAALPGHVRYISVVKADAYGHGLGPMVRRLMQSGVDSFAVANVNEAAQIRHMGSGWPILVLSPVLPGEEGYLLDHDLIATVSTAEEADRLEAIGKARGRSVRVHLKVDTGMGRLGVWHTEAVDFFNELRARPQLQVEGIYTHYSSADSDPEFTREQRERFLAVLGALDTAGLTVHADNSAALDSLQPDDPFNAVRVGLLQFGIPPYPESVLGHAKVEPVFSFHTRVGVVKDLPAGTGVSYQHTCILKRASKVAVLTAGYGDGIPLALSNRGSVLLKGTRCPILGRVTMDQTIVDITDLESSVQAGDEAVLIGEDGSDTIPATEFSDWADSIPWETLCSITKRVERVYVGAREI